MSPKRKADRIIHDPEAEKALLGDLINLPHLIPDVARIVDHSDFADPRHGEAFRIITAHARNATAVDFAILGDELEKVGYPRDNAWMADVISAGSSAWAAHADIVIRLRVARDAVNVVEELRTYLLDHGADPYELIDHAKARLARIHRPITSPPDTLADIDTFLERPAQAGADWVVPGLLRRDWRLILTGVEGGGKSVLMHQLACLAAQGVHPLHPGRDIPHVTTLIVDLENPADRLADAFRPLVNCVGASRYVPGNAWLWHEQAGIDLRTRTDRARFEAVLHTVQPDLVCAGPIYKMGIRRGRETDEEVAADLQECFDDLRTRYGFALMLEAHAPQDQGGYRNLRPFGSSRWLRWPELGFGMRPDDRAGGTSPSATLERWRGDRMSNDWPKFLDGNGRGWWEAGYE